MAFNFNWSPLAADASFYQRARDLLTTALNKSPKPPIIVDDIIVTEFNLGSVPPDLEILEIGDIAADRFRGIFKMCYTGDAFLTLKTRVQANPLNTYLSSKPSFTSPEPLAAASGLTIPLQITLSEIKLSAFIIVVFSKQKGLTLVFRNDPLESLKVSSTFDSIQFVRDYLQRTIEGKLRDLMMDELPAIIHRLSLQLWSPDQVPKADDATTAAGEEGDGEVCVNPLADAPPDVIDVHANPLDIDDYSSLTATDSPEAHQSLFSQKNLVRLAALTNSHRTLSLFTPGIREAVFRAWARPSDRQDGSATASGAGATSPPFATPNMARTNSYTAAATSTTATTTTYTFSDTSSQDHGHLPARSSMVSLGAATTGLSLGANHHHRHPGGRKKKTRVVNLRKSSKKDGAAESAPVSEAGDSASDSVSVQGPLSEPILPVSIPEEEEEEDLEDRQAQLPPQQPPQQLPQQPPQPQQPLYPPLSVPLATIGATLAAAAASRSSSVPTSTSGGLFEALAAEKAAYNSRQAAQQQDQGAEKQREKAGSGTGGYGEPPAVMEKEWIMKMASEIARRVYDENRKNPVFWDRDEAPPAYEAR